MGKFLASAVLTAGMITAGYISYSEYGDAAWILVHGLLGWAFVVWYWFCG